MGGRLASLDALDLILQAGWIVKLVLLVLAVFSIACWTIIFHKWRELRRAAEDSRTFLRIYHEEGVDAPLESVRECEESPLAAVFLDGQREFRRIQKYGGGQLDHLDEAQLDHLASRIRWTAADELARLESRLGFLATTGSAAPFVGLFGTVVGIIDAFENIGAAGSASLAVVAPGIAEALIATAVGLLAAIPATIFYNHFVGLLRSLQADLDLFGVQYERDLRRSAAAPAWAARAAER